MVVARKHLPFGPVNHACYDMLVSTEWILDGDTSQRTMPFPPGRPLSVLLDGGARGLDMLRREGGEGTATRSDRCVRYQMGRSAWIASVFNFISR